MLSRHVYLVVWSPGSTRLPLLSSQMKSPGLVKCIKVDLWLDVDFQSASLRAALQGLTAGEREFPCTAAPSRCFMYISKPARTLSIHSFAGVTAQNNNSSPPDPGTGCIEFRASCLHAYICFVCSDINIKCPTTCFQHSGEQKYIFHIHV